MGQPSYAVDVPSQPQAEPMSTLLARVAQGDRAAFKELYDAAAPHLFGVSLALTRRRDQAEDLLQDAFLAIWQKAGQYAPERGTPMAWMAMIVRHRAIDRMRAAQRRPQDQTTDGVDQLQNIADETAAGHCSPDIAKALSGLSGNQKTAVILAFYEGLTHDELAIRLGAPLGTVKSWVRRGLLALKESLSS